MKKFFKFLFKRKIIFVIILFLLIVGVYFGFKSLLRKDDDVQFVTEKVRRGDLTISISGSGQISALNQIEVKPKVAGDVSIINIKNGQKIEEGDILIQLDRSDIIRSLNEARANLENSRIDLQELLEEVDSYTLLQAENALIGSEDSLIKMRTTQANNYQDTTEAKQKAEDNLEKAYEDAYNNIANTFLDLPDIITELYAVLFSYDISDKEVGVNQNTNNSILLNSIADYVYRADFEKYMNRAEEDYEVAKKDYDANFDNYRNTNRYSERSVIEELLAQTLETTKKVADNIKSETNMLDRWVEYRTDKGFRIYSDVTSYQSSLTSCTGNANSHLSSLLSAQRSIEDYKESILRAERDLVEMDQNNPLEIAEAERSIQEKEGKIEDLKEGATELEIKSKELAIQQKENSLLSVQQEYNDHSIQASFAGIISGFNSAVGDSVTTSTVISSLITLQKIAEITLNEIEAAQIELDQKAILEFDALEGLSIDGRVIEIDVIGNVSSGVVSYGIKIGFDLEDEKIKPGMSVNAEIIIDSCQNALLISSGAIKEIENKKMVSVLVDGEPQLKSVITGLTDEIKTEIIEGLTGGDEVIVQNLGSGGVINPDTKGSSGVPDGNSINGMMRIMR